MRSTDAGDAIPRTYLSRLAHSSAVIVERKKVGEVFHFYGKISVAAIRLTDSTLAIGDVVQIQGPSTNLEQPVETLQIEHVVVAQGEIGQEVGMKVRERVRQKDFVYKLLPPGTPAAGPPVKAKPTKAAPPKPKPRKARPTKPKPRKRAAAKKKPVRKASRSTRRKARRGSRGSRSRSR